jgi:hypothetical protein
MNRNTMNKAFALLTAALLGSAPLTAQDGVRFGLKLSPNMGWIRSDTKGFESSGSALGFTFGLLTEFPIGASGNYRFATGLNLNNTGGKWKETFKYFDAINGPEKTTDLETTAKLQYIELPLTVKLMTNEIGYMRYFAQVGFGNAFNIRARANFDKPVYDATGGYVIDFSEEKGEDISENIALYRASLIVGAGMEYNFSGNTSLLVGVAYNNGFTNVLKGDTKVKAISNYLEITLGVFF